MYEQQHADCSTDDESFEDTALSDPLLKNSETTLSVSYSVKRDRKSRKTFASINDISASSTEDSNNHPVANGDGSFVALSAPEETHCHSVLPTYHPQPECMKLLTAIVMCLIFMVAEIIGGYAAGSLAVMTDAVHLMSDVIAFLVSLFAVWLSRHSPTRKFSFGFYRAEILCALMSIFLIWSITAVFVYLAINRLWSGEYTIKANTMMLVAGIGIVINAVMGFVLHGSCPGIKGAHGHTHSDAHLSNSNINIRAAVVHVVGDLLQSIGVFVSAVVIHFHPGAKIADPICTFVFSILVLATTVTIFRETVHILMEGFPKHLDYAAVMKTLSKIDGVQNVHDLHLWLLSVNKVVLAVHLAIDSTADPDKVLQRATYKMRNKYSIHSLTIQIEKFSSEIMTNCVKCQPLFR